MSKLTEDLQKSNIGRQLTYNDIPRGTSAAIDQGVSQITDSWNNSEWLNQIPRFNKELDAFTPNTAVKDDLSQAPLQGLKTFSNRITPALYEMAIGQTLLDPIMMTNIEESLPILTFGESEHVADGKAGSYSSAGSNEFVSLKLKNDMLTTQDSRTSVWIAQTNAQIVSRLWQQIHTVHDTAFSKELIEYIISVPTSGSSAWTDASGNSFTKRAQFINNASAGMDVFTDIEQKGLESFQTYTDCLMTTEAYAALKKSEDFKNDEYFQNMVNWTGSGEIRTMNGMRMHVSKYAGTGKHLWCYNKPEFAVYGIMSGFNAVAEPWREPKEDLDYLKVKTWYGFCFIDPSRCVKATLA